MKKVLSWLFIFLAVCTFNLFKGTVFAETNIFVVTFSVASVTSSGVVRSPTGVSVNGFVVDDGLPPFSGLLFDELLHDTAINIKTIAKQSNPAILNILFILLLLK